MTANIPDLIANLRQADIAMGDPRDVLNTPRAQEAFFMKKRTIAAIISALVDAPTQLDRMTARLEEWSSKRTAFLAKQAEIEQEIAAAPDPQTDKESNRQAFLARKLELLRAGDLVVAPGGITLGTLGALDARVADLTDRRDRAQAALDGYLKQAEQLLGVTA